MTTQCKAAQQKYDVPPFLGPGETPTLLCLLGRDERDTRQLKEQAQRIVEMRKLRLETQEDVWKALDVHYRTYQNWEAGAVEIRGRNLRKLADYFETTTDYLQYGRRKGRAETPDLATTLDIGAEILKQLGELSQQVSSLDEQLRALRLEVAARDVEEAVRREAERQQAQVPLQQPA